ncbi:hypothetical protein EUGRSUZ_L00919 [Eucalyptus grandis]|uniref:Peptidase C1A papain C-terminal domain-containing protein n=1 Tax=Eucalyptus grandis TaxID=71139 RepID=A0A058ZVD1_EUCGR|nr:hypothetical protein EUGRSUZ_L00919 [Eucalyptus grandis]
MYHNYGNRVISHSYKVNNYYVGSCWVFSVVAVVEGIVGITSGKLSVLFEQQLIDWDATSYGCRGSYPDNAFKYIIRNRGITSRNTYAYHGMERTCNATKAVEHTSYRHGVFNGDCGSQLDHVVVVVGYGKSKDGIAFWKIRNSWGVAWGGGGYMRIQRGGGGSKGMCGLASEASNPLLKNNT